MTEQTATPTTDKDHNSGEVTIPSPVLLGDGSEAPASKRARTKPTSKRKPAGGSTLKKESKAKTTKAKATKETKAKPTTTKANMHGDEITRNWKERLRKISDKKGTTKETKTKVTKEEKAKKASPPTKSTQTINQLSTHHQLILYTMNRVEKEMSYDELTNEIGLSRAVLRKAINAQNNDSLVSNELVAVNQYETEEGETSPYYFEITDTGKKLVRGK